MEELKAGVQYDDLKGSIAVDDADETDLSEYMRQNGILAKNEVAVGFDVWYFDTKNQVDIKVYYTDKPLDALDKDKIQLKVAEFSLSPNDFFSKFKRLNLTLSRHGMLTDEEFEVVE